MSTVEPGTPRGRSQFDQEIADIRANPRWATMQEALRSYVDVGKGAMAWGDDGSHYWVPEDGPESAGRRYADDVVTARGELLEHHSSGAVDYAIYAQAGDYGLWNNYNMGLTAAGGSPYLPFGSPGSALSDNFALQDEHRAEYSSWGTEELRGLISGDGALIDNFDSPGDLERRRADLWQIIEQRGLTADQSRPSTEPARAADDGYGADGGYDPWGSGLGAE